MEENLEHEFLNIEFRILVAEEALKEVEQRAKSLLSDIDSWKQKYATATADDEDYWTAD